MKKVQIKLIGLAIFLTMAGVAWAVDCGDGVAACSCEDKVVSDTVLNGTDPVTTTVCTGAFALEVEPGVKLDMGFRTITGNSGATQIGIKLNPGSGAQILNGTIQRFGDGIVGTNVDDATLSRLIVQDMKGDGIFLDKDVPGNTSDRNVITATTVRRVGRNCVAITGNDNEVSLCRLQVCAATAVLIDGKANILARNQPYMSGVGLDVRGVGAELSQNKVTYSASDGIRLSGKKHILSLNIVQVNGRKVTGDGLAISATDSLISRNRFNYNSGFGIDDDTSGGGTGGTANTYEGNRCSGNGLGASSPANLCR